MIVGESTQNQDQVITLHSLRTIKTIVRTPKNPIPPLTSTFAIISIFCILYTFLKGLC